MKILSTIALVISIVALAVSAIALNKLKGSVQGRVEAKFSSPQELASALSDQKSDYAPVVFAERNREQIKKSTVVSDIHVSPDNQIALILTRYTVDGKNFKAATWARNLGGFWFKDYVSTYKPDKLVLKNKEWVERMGKIESEWKAGSASIYE